MGYFKCCNKKCYERDLRLIRYFRHIVTYSLDGAEEYVIEALNKDNELFAKENQND